jgi:asparaginyl-tRNA synthetase
MAQHCLRRSLQVAGHTRTQSYHSRDVVVSVAGLLESPASSSNVTVNGFVRSVRRQKTRSFAAIGDGTSLEPLQALLTPDQAEKYS